MVDEATLAARTPAAPDLSANDFGMGRELFAGFRALATRADTGAAVFG
jgi:phosphogluconate dehydratase